MKTESRKIHLRRRINKTKTKKREIDLSNDRYDNLLREMEYYKRTIEELQDELDAYEAEQIKKTAYQTAKFDLNDYVSDRDRKISTKNSKKPSLTGKRKNSKIYK